ncbi:hypothetical protein [Nocardia sp. NPDC050793]|uniref:hypothetical protein n=1 Tax=Nocardia sp. NPDC050793 TaxID=3155159 RepID=UPI0033C18BCA
MLHDVTNDHFARKVIDKGADGIVAVAGLDPDNLPQSDPSAMNFGSTGFDASFG